MEHNQLMQKLNILSNYKYHDFDKVIALLNLYGYKSADKDILLIYMREPFIKRTEHQDVQLYEGNGHHCVVYKLANNIVYREFITCLDDTLSFRSHYWNDGELDTTMLRNIKRQVTNPNPLLSNSKYLRSQHLDKLIGDD